ncbi:CLOCK-interacting pacemaker isoform X1 [Alligator sinensis]|uniref:CLOCK-interacting pacemaker isoform X1 n=1 Tax=Alligator sinensis TaxID=38654 RepID=A0A1U7S762_ALLSI|nr:CLOCK-interacting pacemaker isoform X1 [Alligator sinensis]XP_014381326.1 CLOCK-interacting pacemaker isoform X1 [Alligator sinensis]XP_025047958.1 CLOCK-interacting pacemaker isoform X1 [Alligator sinensis]
MERKYPSRESSRKLLGKMMEMKKLSHHFNMAAAESDKDSGFSDGSSECLGSMEQTDSEDRLNTFCWNSEDGPWQCPVTTSNSFPALSPMVVMKNVLVKQGSSSSQLQSWTVQPSFEVIPAQPQLVFLHPHIAPPVNPHFVGKKRNDSTNYLPILNSYTKIAPHPCKRDRDLERDETSRQKRLCTEAPKRETSPSVQSNSSLPSSPCGQLLLGFKPAQDSNQQSTPASVAGGKMSSMPSFQCVSTDNQKAPGLTPFQASKCTSHEIENPAQHLIQSAICSQPLAPEERCTTPELFLQQQSKCRRFQNTWVVLRRSGLLEITLKTKELIHQNQVTQIQLDRLKQQTQLFMEAIKNNAPQAWEELQASLTGSERVNSSLESTYPSM